MKIWNSGSGFCFVTFGEGGAGVKGVAFSPHGNAVVAAALDGSVRAYDLVRYRCFRTFLPPRPAQLAALALDPSGELLCASTLDSFEVYVWSMQTGRLLDTLTGHTGPVSCLAFGGGGQTLLASGSWDRSVRLWELGSRDVRPERLQHSSDVLALAFRPDGRELAVACLDGTITLWDPAEGIQLGSIEGRLDVGAGRRIDDPRTAHTNTWGKCFSSLCYSADGRCLLAGGQTRYVCIYEVQQRALLRRFQLSHNLSLDGVLDFLNSRLLTEAGPLELLPDDSSDDESEKYAHTHTMRFTFSR